MKGQEDKEKRKTEAEQEGKAGQTGMIKQAAEAEQSDRAAAWWLSNIPDWGAVRIRQILQILGSPEAVYEAAARAAGKNGGPAALEEELWRQVIARRFGGSPGAQHVCRDESQDESQDAWQDGWQSEWQGDWDTGTVRWRITKENIASLIAAVPAYEACRAAYEEWIGQGGGFVTAADAGYPGRLLPFWDRPYALYYRGKLPDEGRGTAAVIGARACSSYGRKYAREFARELAAHGVQIISGLAYGIDSEGHLGALESGRESSTWAVLGCGADICYPKEHEWLYGRILEQGGGILSEYAPGTKPLPKHFPMRNRIISGLSDCVLIMEARKRSGSLITVDLALEQGKEIFALPGRTGDQLSEGCLQLIRNGAGILTDCGEVLEFLQGKSGGADAKAGVGTRGRIAGKPDAQNTDDGTAAESTEEKAEGSAAEGAEENVKENAEHRILAALDSGEENLEGLMRQTGLPLAAVQETVLELLLEEKIEEVSVGFYGRKNLRP